MVVKGILFVLGKLNPKYLEGELGFLTNRSKAEIPTDRRFGKNYFWAASPRVFDLLGMALWVSDIKPTFKGKL